ncbi:MAG: hypothetical protein ACYCZ3_12495 [Thiobacillus sp.]
MPLPLSREYGAHRGAAARRARPSISHFSTACSPSLAAQGLRGLRPMQPVACLARWRSGTGGKTAD